MGHPVTGGEGGQPLGGDRVGESAAQSREPSATSLEHGTALFTCYAVFYDTELLRAVMLRYVTFLRNAQGRPAPRLRRRAPRCCA